MYKVIALLTALLLTLPLQAQLLFEDSFESSPGARSCRSNDDCSAVNYCQQEEIGAEGMCIKRPQACTADVVPVCGFDNQTYSNACVAEAMGVNVLHQGECILPMAAGSFTTAKRWLYDRAHFDHMTTFYCGCDYDADNAIDLDSCDMTDLAAFSRANRVEAEHVFPASQFGNFRVCWREPAEVCGDEDISGRDCCLKVDPVFENAHNDLNNLRPSNGHVNARRSDYNWGMIEGELREYGACDFETDSGTRRAEPAANAQGDIARTMLYMSETYGFNLSDQDKQLYAAWNNTDPPDDWEIQRHERIKDIQGVGNSFIENYRQLDADMLRKAIARRARPGRVNSGQLAPRRGRLEP